ncbi:MAG: ArnT family glycosyltransferase, partial [Pyrinomonadaceae bacterium]
MKADRVEAAKQRIAGEESVAETVPPLQTSLAPDTAPLALVATNTTRPPLFTRPVAIALALLFLLGFGLRLGGVGEIGFAEDEINKLEAVRAYARGRITPNAEHPMLMKSLMLASVSVANAWNAHTGPQHQSSDEAALRFPNVFFGALTVLPLFLLTAALFGRQTGLVAAALWAFGTGAITYNRIAKEDTLLVFFMLLAFFCYLRAKQSSGFEPARKRRYYAVSAVAFGLMFASKYFPHYFGLNMLYHHLVPQRERLPGEPRGRTPAFFYPLVALAFLVANPAVLLPETWRYLTVYSSEQLLTHHGYLMGDTLYLNQMSATPFGGTPFYFYLLFLAIKTPLPLLVAFVVGLCETVRRRREPGGAFLLLMFLLWIVPYSLAGAKWLRYALSLLPFVYMIAAVGVMWVMIRLAPRVGEVASFFSPAQVVRVLALAFFVLAPAWSALTAGPHYALYTNPLAAGRAGYFFPHDEFYDDGLREAIRYVAERAPPGATIIHETPGVVRHYLQKISRTDLHSRVLSAADFTVSDAPTPSYFILQRGRTYFENREKMDEVRARLTKVYEGRIKGASAVEVYVK